MNFFTISTLYTMESGLGSGKFLAINYWLVLCWIFFTKFQLASNQIQFISWYKLPPNLVSHGGGGGTGHTGRSIAGGSVLMGLPSHASAKVRGSNLGGPIFHPPFCFICKVTRVRVVKHYILNDYFEITLVLRGFKYAQTFGLAY